MVHFIDVTNLPDILRQEIGTWIDTDREPHARSGGADDLWFPLYADDKDQLEARKELLRDGTIPPGSGSVRIKGRRSLP